MTNTSRTVAGLALALALAASPAAAAHATPASINVPNSVSLKATDFSMTMKVLYDSGSYANQPAANGQYCDTTDNGATGNEARPLGGRQWLWSQYDSNDPQFAATEIVTLWANGKGALADLQNDTGYCRFAALNLPGFVVTDKTATDFGATWSPADFMGPSAVHSRLVGDVLVSVTLDTPAGTTKAMAVTEATRLAGIAADRVQRSGLTKNGPKATVAAPKPVATTDAEKAKVAADAAQAAKAAPAVTTVPARTLSIISEVRRWHQQRPLAV